MIRVLIADDEHLIRAAIATLLGLEPDIEVVDQVADGAAVTTAVARHRPDVVILDIEMPGMDGLAVAESLGGHPPVLILTNFGRPGYLRRALAAGVRGFLPKDSPVEELAAAIRTVHRGGRHIDPELAASAMMAGDCPLTRRERDALALADKGVPIREIARSLCLTEGTVRNYLSSAVAKLGAPNRAAAIKIAQEMGWL